MSGDDITYVLEEKIIRSLLSAPPQASKCDIHRFTMEAICVNEPDWSDVYCAKCFADRSKHRCTNPQIQSVEEFIATNTNLLEGNIATIRSLGGKNIKLFEQLWKKMESKLLECTTSLANTRRVHNYDNEGDKYKNQFLTFTGNINNNFKNQASTKQNYPRMMPVKINMYLANEIAKFQQMHLPRLTSYEAAVKEAEGKVFLSWISSMCKDMPHLIDKAFLILQEEKARTQKAVKSETKTTTNSSYQSKQVTTIKIDTPSGIINSLKGVFSRPQTQILTDDLEQRQFQVLEDVEVPKTTHNRYYSAMRRFNQLTSAGIHIADKLEKLLSTINSGKGISTDSAQESCKSLVDQLIAVNPKQTGEVICDCSECNGEKERSETLPQSLRSALERICEEVRKCSKYVLDLGKRIGELEQIQQEAAIFKITQTTLLEDYQKENDKHKIQAMQLEATIATLQQHNQILSKQVSAERERTNKYEQEIAGHRELVETMKEKSVITESKFHSQIVSGEDRAWIIATLRNKVAFRQSQIIYNAKQSAFDASTYHHCCDQKHHTVLIGKTKDGKLFGGYAELPLGEKSEGNRSFIFSITNREEMPLKPVSKVATTLDLTYGPIFGDSDLSIQGSKVTSNFHAISAKYVKVGTSQVSSKEILIGGVQAELENYEIIQLIL